MTAPYKADLIAAERLLKAAVREAVAVYRANDPSPFDHLDVADMLAEATRSADLLLGGRAT